MMIINIGSLNKVKIQAVREAIKRYDFWREAEVKGVDVNLGVSRQPKTLEETISGAKDRAYNAFFDCECAVGLESGINFILF